MAVRIVNGHRVVYVPYEYDSIMDIERHWNEEKAFSIASAYWAYCIPISIAYVVVIFALEWFMRDRKAFNLKTGLVVWNSLLAVFSIVGTYRFGLEFVHAVSGSFTESVCLSIDPTTPAGFWATAFGVSKLVELFDTVFLVLRKRPLIFLHWYHHAVVVIAVWHAAIGFTASARWFAIMNYAVHSVMYTYYALAAAGVRLPRRVSMCVTTLQIAQMVVGVGITLYVLAVKLAGGFCQQTASNLALLFTIYASFFFLFARFFHKAYIAAKPKKLPENGVKETKVE